MLDFIDPDPVQAVLRIGLIVAIVLVGIFLWTRVSRRVRRHGGGTLALILTAVAIVGLLASLYPDLIPFDIGLMVLILSLVTIYRPEEVVRVTRGPRIEWRALREGRELQQLVARRGNPLLAKLNPEIRDRFEALGTFEAPVTAAYIGMLRETLFADPAAADTDEKRARLAVEDASLRARLGAPPIWEAELAERSRAESTGALE
jgi:hypothetical protein